MTAPPPPDASISTRLLLRVIILLISVWCLAAGIVLIGFHGASSGALGAGIADDAGQRIVGAQLLILVPAFVVIAMQIERYPAMLWLPFGSQAAMALTIAFSILSGETSFSDGILPVVVGFIFVGLLGFVWITEQRSIARAKIEAAEVAASESALRQDELPPGDEA